MKYVIDPHTHTIACNHAFSTLEENIQCAKQRGIELLCYTEHGPRMPYAPPDWYYEGLSMIPSDKFSIPLIIGIEANILDEIGTLDSFDLPEKWFNFVIASMHKHTYQPFEACSNTDALLAVLDNANVDMLGHIDAPYFAVDYEPVIKKAAKSNTLIEFNNASVHGVRKGGIENMRQMAVFCKKYDCMVALSSDAHLCHNVGVFDDVLPILQEANFPQELIINTDVDKFFSFLRTNGKNV
mgnify:CR=1 FL=1